MASRAGAAPNFVLDAVHKGLSALLVGASVTGLGALFYGAYRIKFVMPVEVPRLKAAAAAAGGAPATAPPSDKLA